MPSVPERTTRRDEDRVITLEPLPVGTQTRLVDELVRQLRDAILSGELPPGTPLRQAELSSQLGVSRTPLREAFRVLEHGGLVNVYDHNRTVKVAHLSVREVEQLYELRVVIDPLAARLTARRGLSQTELRGLCDALERMDDAVEPFDWKRFNAAHVEFHALIAELSGNPYVTALVPTIQLGTMAFAQLLAAESDASRSPDGQPSIRTVRPGQLHHREIYQAIADQDEDRAESTALEHMSTTLEIIRSPQWPERWSGVA